MWMLHYWSSVDIISRYVVSQVDEWVMMLGILGGDVSHDDDDDDDENEDNNNAFHCMHQSSTIIKTTFLSLSLRNKHVIIASVHLSVFLRIKKMEISIYFQWS